MGSLRRSASLIVAVTLLAACGNGPQSPDAMGDGASPRDGTTGSEVSNEAGGNETSVVDGAPESAAPDVFVFDAEAGAPDGDVTNEGGLDAVDRDTPIIVGDSNGETSSMMGDGEVVDSGLAPDPMCAMRREVCDGVDNNCDGRVDEICPCEPGTTQRCYGGDARQAGVGVCSYGMQTCVPGTEFGQWGPCTGWAGPRAPRCMGDDDLCNREPDRGCECMPGAMRECYTGPEGTAGVGLCRRGMQRCVMETGRSRWGACEGQVIPEPTRCDGIDRACTGDPSIGCECVFGERRPCYTGPMETRRVGECRDGMQRCISGPSGAPTWGRCEGEVLPATGMNACDGRDRACNGNPRTGCTCIEGERESCYTGPDGTAGRGICRAGMRTCVRTSSGGTEWGACMGQVLPSGMNNCDGVDRQCTGMPFLGCACTPGATQSCYPAAPSTMNVGRCRAGTQTCGGTPPAYGACMGAVTPNATEICGNMIDDNCNGMVDEGCSCPGDRACYTGPPRTRRVGNCRDGMYNCVTGPTGMGMLDMSSCPGQVLPAVPPMCTPMSSMTADVNCDGLPDCRTRCLSGWQIYRTPNPVCYGATYAECGFGNEFSFAPPLPAEDAPGWEPVMDARINFGTNPTSPDRRSRLIGRSCSCRNGGDFTFFQTLFNLGESSARPGQSDAMNFALRIGRINNAVRVTLYNSRSPTGRDLNAFNITAATCDMANISGDSRVDPMILAANLAPGKNRIVITLLDDCIGERELTDVNLLLDGRALELCSATPTGM